MTLSPTPNDNSNVNASGNDLHRLASQGSLVTYALLFIKLTRLLTFPELMSAPRPAHKSLELYGSFDYLSLRNFETYVSQVCVLPTHVHCGFRV